MSPQRPLFWSIEGAWLFYLLAAVSLGIFAYGVVARVALWLRGPRPPGQRLGARDVGTMVLDGLLGRRIFRGDVAAGTMHALVAWGFFGLVVATVLSALDHYVVTFLRGQVYLVYAIGADIAGVMLLAGLLWALVRRYLQRVARLETRRGDWVVLLWLLAACLSGFWVEGLRLSAQQPPWAEWSFAGRWVSLLWSEPWGAEAIYPMVWWLHALLSLSLIAAIPYTKLFHMLAAPTSLALSRQRALVLRAEQHSEPLDWSLRERVFFDGCTQCGRCVEVCPSTGAGEPFSPREIIISLRERLWRVRERQRRPRSGEAGAASSHEAAAGAASSWYCTTCSACLEVCPVCVSTPDAVRELRRQQIEQGTAVPPALSQTLEKLFKYGNPWEASKKKRGKWFKELGLRDLTRESGRAPDGTPLWCYFVGCTTAIDTRAQAIARCFVRLLDHAGVPFGILGKKEPCCGDIARRVGEDGLFEEQVEGCLELFRRHGISRVVTSSPHCLHTFRNEYPLLPPSGAGPDGHGAATDTAAALPEARHYVELLDELVRKGMLRFTERLAARVTFHDPCYLGRHNSVIEAPRRLLRAVPGLTLVEMPHHGVDSLCCGGGGGRMWQEELEAETKMSEIRIREAADTGADIVVTACPLCLIMLEDARKTAGLEDSLEVLDLNELLVRTLGASCDRDGEPGRNNA